MKIYITFIYKKPSYTNVIMNYDSCTPLSWKKKLIKYLFHRSEKLVFKDLQTNDLIKIKKLRVKYIYPIKFVENE